MKRWIAVLAATVTALAAAGAGLGAYRLVRDDGPHRPEISAYSHGQLTRVGPYEYCHVLDLTDCATPHSVGVLSVNRRDRVQVAVPRAIARAPWVLTRVYEDGPVVKQFAPGTAMAVTIPTIDPHLGRLQGVVVQLLTLVRLPNDDLQAAVHAEWSVRTVWD